MTGEIDNSLPFESQTGEPLCMSRIAIVRHGEFGVDNRLNKRGRAQMKKIARQIRESLDKGEKALILTSPADRAFDSAKVISDILIYHIQNPMRCLRCKKRNRNASIFSIFLTLTFPIKYTSEK